MAHRLRGNARNAAAILLVALGGWLTPVPQAHAQQNPPVLRGDADVNVPIRLAQGPTQPLGGQGGAGTSNPPGSGNAAPGDGLPLPPVPPGVRPPQPPAGGSAGAPPPAPAGPGLGPTQPLGGSAGGNVPTPTGPGGLNMPLGEPGPGPSASSAKCAPGAPQGKPITPEQVLGNWSDAGSGEVIEIKPRAGAGAGALEFAGRRKWEGTLQGQTLRFSTIPAADQLGEAPGWARQMAAGKIKWELELEVKTECGQLVLEGNWFPGSFKWSSTIDPNSGQPPIQSVSDIGRGTPIAKKYTLPPPAIADVIPLDDQTALLANGAPKWPYVGSASRLLFVYGRGLPRSWSETIEFKSGDATVRYFAVALSTDRNLPQLRREQFELGWSEARKNLDPETVALIKDFPAMLVQATLQPGVLPGAKAFTLNGMEGAWRLRFGDDRAAISFMREITVDFADPADALFLPERVFLEVRTGADFPIDALELRLAVNEAPVTWNGARTLVARRTKPGIYRTDFIEFVDKGKPMPAAEKGVFFLPAQVKDQIDVRLDDPFLFGVTPPGLAVTLRRTPAELGETWKEALVRAARANGIADTPDWSRLSATRATEISNHAISPIILKTLTSATALGLLRYVPKVYKFIDEVEAGQLNLSTPVTIGEHAVLLLFRDQFLKDMKTAVEKLDQIKGEMALRGFREAVKASAWDENSPWRYLTVSCPASVKLIGDCSFPLAVSDNFLETQFGKDRAAAHAWSVKAVDEALRKYRQAARDAIARAEKVDDKDIEELLKLVGYGYYPLLPKLNARMMRLVEVGTPKRLLWIPDLNGRYQLRNLHTVADAVRAQKDYAALDTQMAMLMASAAAAPFMVGEGVLAAAIGWALDAVFLGVTLTSEIPEFIEQRKEVKFALGASLLLGTQRLREAELRQTEWYQLLLSLGGNIAGGVISTTRVVGAVRSSLILGAVEKGGIKAYEALSAADKTAFWRYVSEAKLIEEIGDVKALTAMHKRASAAAEEIFTTMKASADRVRANARPPVVAIGEAGPLPKTRTLRHQPEPLGARIGVNQDGELVEIEGYGKTKKLETEEAKGPAKPGEQAEAVEGPKKPDGQKADGGAEPKKGGSTDQYGAGPPSQHGPGDAQALKPPEVGGDFTVRVDGRPISVKIHAKLGKGGYADVYLIVDSRIPGCEKGCALKTYDPTTADLFLGKGAEQVNYVRMGAEELGDDIPQMKNLHYAADAPQPYIIQELLGSDENWMYFSKSEWGDITRVVVEFRRRPELADALLELFAKMRNKGLVWEDSHLRNVYFRKVDNKWIAGVLDQDRIMKWTANRKDFAKYGNMGAFFGLAESHYMPRSVNSMEPFQHLAPYANEKEVPVEALQYYRERPGPYLRDIDLFWEKNMERKHWLLFQDGNYHELILDPEKVEKVFPRLRQPERLGPFDPGVEFNLPRQNGWLNVIPFKARQLAARRDGVPLRRAA